MLLFRHISAIVIHTTHTQKSEFLIEKTTETYTLYTPAMLLRHV